ncbi:MAG: hypothetical protein DIU79_11095 [Actinobacteria bacterium]|nr:MAG: hypothetical protein DIU79_11095 [Actinomycetota bacterium]
MFDVVQDEEPARVGMEPAECPASGFFVCGYELGVRLEPVGELGEPGVDGGWAVGGDPPHQ